MIDPVIFTIKLFGREFPLHWYGVIVMLGVVAGSFIVERKLRHHGEKSDYIWDALIWVLPVGIIGARLWYVLNATAGGNNYYIENPIQILNTRQGGLHIFGGFLLGAAALLLFLRRNKLDPWLFLDAAGPAALIGQGIGRIANFINQELYGPPTDLPWGIPIAAEHRMPQFQSLDPSTRFHPTFAYEMLWNFATAGLLLWLARRYEKQLKPGTIFAGWLLAAGIGRTWLELFFRPDQPKISGLGISYSAIFAALMAIAGAVFLMVRYKAINPAFAENWEEEYKLSTPVDQSGEKVETEGAEDEVKEPVKQRDVLSAKKKPATGSVVKRKLVRRSTVRRATKTTRDSTGTTQTSESSNKNSE